MLVFHSLHEIPKWHRNICASHFIFKKVDHFGPILKLASFGNERDVMIFEGKNWMGAKRATPWPQNGAYLPPEFLSRGEYGMATDIWGLGVLLF